LHHFNKHSSGGSRQNSQTIEKNASISERRKILCISLYIGISSDSTKNSVELINEYNKVTGFKIMIQKSVTFSFMINKNQEAITFVIPTKLP
jgi:hypothetical protein